MKTKTLLLLCLFLGIGLTQLSAQKGKNENGTVKYVGTFEPWSIPVFCGGTMSDMLYFPSMTVTWWLHFKDGVAVRGINKVETTQGILLSTGEVYKVEASFDHWSDAKGFDNFQMHLIGDKGGNIMVHARMDFSTGEFYDIKANCH